jgi:hypothetical protein
MPSLFWECLQVACQPDRATEALVGTKQIQGKHQDTQQLWFAQPWFLGGLLRNCFVVTHCASPWLICSWRVRIYYNRKQRHVGKCCRGKQRRPAVQHARQDSIRPVPTCTAQYGGCRRLLVRLAMLLYL